MPNDSTKFELLNSAVMLKNILPLYSWDNGAFIMIVVFSIVIIAIVGFVISMMNSKNKKD